MSVPVASKARIAYRARLRSRVVAPVAVTPAASIRARPARWVQEGDVMPPIESSGIKGVKVPQHPVPVGLESGENLERGGSLKYSHTASVERAATELSRRSHQLSLEWKIHYLGNP